MDILKRMLISAGLFGFLGPPVGALVIVLLAVASILSDGTAGASPVGAVLGMTMLAVLFSYPMGLAPALVTGLICGTFERRVQADWHWIAACAAVGGSVTAVYSGLVTSIGLGNAGSSLITLGAFAAAVCGWARRTARRPGGRHPSKFAVSAWRVSRTPLPDPPVAPPDLRR